MNKFTEYKNLDLTAIADEVSKFWNTHETFKKSVEPAPENRNMCSTKVRLPQTECREFTT